IFTVIPGQESFIVLDFGKEVVGFPVIIVRDGGECTIDIGYSETLDRKGDVYPIRQDILQADRVIMRGGRREWQCFGRRAFRYMQLTFRDLKTPIDIESVSITNIGYPVEQVSSFECSDELLNKIWNKGLDTLKICMQDAYEDCPLREHAQYPGDARVQALMNYYCFNDKKLAEKALTQFVQRQREDGLFNAVAPSSTNHILPDYNLVWVIMLHDYYLYTNGLVLVEKLYDNMKLLLDNWILTQAADNGLLTYEPNPDVPFWEWWLFIDHMPLDKHGEVAAYNAFYYQALKDASKLAKAVGNSEDAVKWHERAESVKAEYNKRFWNDEKGAYIDCFANNKQSEVVSIQTNTLSVVFGLTDINKNNQIRELIKKDCFDVKSSGPYFDFYVLQCMNLLGLIDESIDHIKRMWGEMLNRGASTWWETFDPNWPEDVICDASLCHAWSSAPTYYLPAEILGIRPLLPERDEVFIQPKPSYINVAKGTIHMKGQNVDINWVNNPASFTIEINAPAGFSIALPIYNFKNPIIEEIDLLLDDKKVKTRKNYGWGNIIWKDNQERDPYRDWLKDQESDLPEGYIYKTRCSINNGYLFIQNPISTYVRYNIYERDSI
ncbi:MAG: family 78 glycoside hydrolase catalytic domain, partial [Armatimonadota bacterium]